MQFLLPHSFIFGHLIVMAKVMKNVPRDAYGQEAPLLLAKAYPEVARNGLVYMDLWPIASPMLAVFHPDMMAQFTQEMSLPKHELLRGELRPLTSCVDLLNLEGAEWKKWRAIFNPGFSAKNLMSMMPEVLEEIDVFRSALFEAAESGEAVQMVPLATKVTVDIVGRVVL